MSYDRACWGVSQWTIDEPEIMPLMRAVEHAPNAASPGVHFGTVTANNTGDCAPGNNQMYVSL